VPLDKVAAADRRGDKPKKESVISKLARSSAQAKNEVSKKSLADQISVTREGPSLNGVVNQEVVRVAKVEDFKIGDKVVYPGHGVGEITSFRAKSIGGTEQRIFDITMLESGMKIMVPVVQAQAVGLRKVVDKKAIDEVYTILKMRDCKIDTQTWNRRFREYTQKIKTGSVFEIAEVLRDLTVLSVEKELSFGEKKMLDTAQALLVSEISIAKSKPQERVMGDLQEIFS
jgi:CarD family transcriptional regulator